MQTSYAFTEIFVLRDFKETVFFFLIVKTQGGELDGKNTKKRANRNTLE